MKDDQRKGEGLRSDDGGDGLSFLLGLVFFSMVMVMVVIISLSSVWGLRSILKSHGHGDDDGDERRGGSNH